MVTILVDYIVGDYIRNTLCYMLQTVYSTTNVSSLYITHSVCVSVCVNNPELKNWLEDQSFGLNVEE